MKLLILSYILTIFSAVILDVAFESFVFSNEIIQYQNQIAQSDRMLSDYYLVIVPTGILILILLPICIWSLWTNKPYGGKLFLFFNIITLIATPFMGDHISSGIGMTLVSISYIITGMILVLSKRLEIAQQGDAPEPASPAR